jgi:hypothetical protein
MAERKTIPQATQTEVLQNSGRRCCLCVGLDNNKTETEGQIAHLDGDRSNSEIANLVFLCLKHHNQYDSRTSQSKGLTKDEVRTYRHRLYANLRSIIDSQRRAGDVTASAHVSAGNGSNGKGGDALIEGGTGFGGASGGNVSIGPGTYKGGDGGPGGAGGNLTIKGGDAK